MRPGRLTALAVKKLKAPGRYSDGGNLYLHIRPSGTRGWVLRFTMAGEKPREMGLGASADVTLAEARERARDARRQIEEARDPIEARKLDRQEAAAPGFTFQEVAALYTAAHQDGWRNAKHRAQWISTLDTYAHPVLGSLPVSKVTVGDVLRVLEPMWKATPETASRVRGRIEAVLDYAAARS